MRRKSVDDIERIKKISFKIDETSKNIMEEDSMVSIYNTKKDFLNTKKFSIANKNDKMIISS